MAINSVELQRDDLEPIQEFLLWVQGNRCPEQDDPTSTFRSRYFIPYTRLKSYLGSTKKLERLLDALYPGQDASELPPRKNITEQYLRTFSILLCIGMGRFVKHFVQHDSLQDSKLPFTSRPARFPVSSDPNFDIFELFQRRQWEFCAQTLKYDMHNYFDTESVLPIIRRKKIAEGGSARVYKIELEAEYNELEPPDWEREYEAKKEKTNEFVLKSYRTRNAENYFKAELRAHKMLRHGREPPPNVVGFLGSFIRDETYNMIFEYADKGSLEKYMQAVHPPRDIQDRIAFWASLLGVLRGLALVHGSRVDAGLDEPNDFSGWHQDVTPANIVVLSKPQGSDYESYFKLADFGLSHFKKDTSPQVLDKDTLGTRSYGIILFCNIVAVSALSESDKYLGAPDTFRLDDSFSRATFQVRQSVDIWSFGCILSECASWTLKGWRAVEDYRYRRRAEIQYALGLDAGDCFHDGSHVLPAVILQHSNLRDMLERKDSLTRWVLDSIDEEMLVDDLARAPAKQLYHQSVRAIMEVRKGFEDLRSSSTTCNTLVDDNQPLPSRSQDTVPITQKEEMHHGSHLALASSTASASDRTNSLPAMQSPALASPRASASDRTYPLSAMQSLDAQASNSKGATLEEKASHREAWSGINQNEAKGHEFAPSMSISDLLSRKDRKPAGLSSQSYLLNGLKNRDHVFLIDNSVSMTKHRREIWDVLEGLTKILRDQDPDGIDLYFTSSDRKLKARKLKEIRQSMEKNVPDALTNMSHSLSMILQDHSASADRSKTVRNFLLRRRRPKPLSLYVLTDGVWQPKSDPTGMIRALANDLGDLKVQYHRVQIQFIQFGSDSRAQARLKHLDSELELEDIVDVTPADGNVWKMLLGAMNHWFDVDDPRHVSAP
ncbi:uncharacterized protein KY384_000903 [Bacidia gigantensis]|uniref:uncharacterized protein n=1 Tax=Bacidia gigantensis TaxID=2732470 RepID=UPI001D0377B1|nr:uncharacterized protein KY384_000903 [Bacidia gigantensis]KAG8534060.1 hypothetical protein KY384_000903 [Bacidia gigantensis]